MTSSTGMFGSAGEAWHTGGGGGGNKAGFRDASIAPRINGAANDFSSFASRRHHNRCSSSSHARRDQVKTATSDHGKNKTPAKVCADPFYIGEKVSR